MLKNYFNEEALIKWWHGNGGLLDYSNPEARNWWHSQLDKLLDLGIDGWKCDGTDPYLELVVGPRGFSGPMSLPEYQDLYYGDFYNYTLSKNPDGLIMSRPVDSFQVSKGQISAFLPFSPKYVMFSGWVGD
jgi:alpha-glucosidase (family GH31 glycosyl hydrolase)